MQILNNVYIQGNIKIRGHYHATGKYIISTHKDCNIKLTIKHKFLIVFHNLKNFYSHLNMQ